MAESSHDVIQPEVLSPRPREAIVEDRRNLEARRQAEYSVYQPILAQIDEIPSGTTEEADQYFKDHQGEIVDPANLPPNLRPYSDLLVAYQGYNRWFDSCNTEARSLEKEELPYLREDLINLVNNLSARLDYQALLDFSQKARLLGRPLGSDDLLINQINQIASLRHYEYSLSGEVPAPQDPDFYTFGLRTLDRYREKWSQRGFLQEEPRPDYLPKFIPPSEDRSGAETFITTQALDINQKLNEHYRLVNIYCHNNPQLKQFSSSDSILETITRVLGSDKITPDHTDITSAGFHPDLLAAFQHYIYQKYQQHSSAGRLPLTEESHQALRQKIESLPPVDQMISQIQFEGFTPPGPDLVAVATEEDVIQTLKRFPARFIQPILSVSHREPTPDELKTKTMICGTNTVVYGEGDDWDLPVGTRVNIVKENFVKADTDPTIRGSLKHEFLNTLIHELGHNMHSLLDHEDMHAWEVVSEADPVLISWYVDFSRKKDPNLGKREDFCETTKIFLSNPLLLQVLSPARFQYMTTLFEKYSPAEQFKKLLEDLKAKIETVRFNCQRLNISMEQMAKRHLNWEFKTG